uniref:Peptidase M3A/M3B catalytic domain-containing protein n=1 Tax=Rhizochromulina marina TaxID=1034831 RepID=A0A7S2S766_9STRA|mmetsp:Transcript_26070/g.76060  ORF Transcript_26070/g.76060 Transcript_26070/m.76060 type:complete len:649 (+) Transcript_26070:38-1984(+)
MESPAKRAKTAGDAEIQEFLDSVNSQYEKLHLEFEAQFWGTKMALQEPEGSYSTVKLSTTKEAMEAFLRRPDLLQRSKELLATGKASETQQRVLECFVKALGCYQMSDPAAVELRHECTVTEDDLGEKRNTMKLGFRDATAGGEFVEQSSVGLRTTLKTAPQPEVRRAAWEGLRSIGTFILSNGFVELVKHRNAMARKLGYEDFYDYKVTQAEGFGKARLFEILDTLLHGSQKIFDDARSAFQTEKGETALEAWNVGFLMAGDVELRQDAYFPFEKSVENWGRSFSKMGIRYQGATMTLDLFDRKGKYSNAFCHWPQPAWRKPSGDWQPSVTNFTSLADPSAVGSGKTALTTLMHEAGHAAHFANIDQPSPLFSQERAPTSVAYAENQSMFLDSLVKDAAWRVRYARNRKGEPLPWELHEAEVRATHKYQVFLLRSMLSVPYFEKALYELPEDQITAEAIQALADKVETEVQGELAARPLLSVPHIISDESSCYYHGYVLAEMSVFQTRKFFLRQGPIVDNPNIGKTLTQAYWQPGNSAMFLDLVENLTGEPLTGAAWIEALEEDLEVKLAREKIEYDQAMTQMGSAAASASPSADGSEAADVNLDMRIVIKDGDFVIADSDKDGTFLNTCKTFEGFVRSRFLKDKDV